MTLSCSKRTIGNPHTTPRGRRAREAKLETMENFLVSNPLSHSLWLGCLVPVQLAVAIVVDVVSSSRLAAVGFALSGRT